MIKKCVGFNLACFAMLGILLSVLGSCSSGEGPGELFGGSSQAPVFLEHKAVSETEIDFKFSLPVKVTSIVFSPVQEVSSIEHGSTVRVTLQESPGVGVPLVADLLAEDEHGNTINVLVPFRSRNNRVPDLLINELRTEFIRPRAEFIEFRIKSDGNLGALRLFIASNPRNPMVYEFPPVEVKNGDLVVLHLRTLDENASRDELGDRLDESGGQDASSTARDLWIPGSTKLLRKTDAVYLLDQDNRVLSAVMLSENRDAQWQREHFQEAAEFLFSQGAWMSPDGGFPSPLFAVDSSGIGTAATRSVSRDEAAANTNTAADWFIAGTGGATPGRNNITRPSN